MSPRDRLARLDRLAVPDLRDEFRQRALEPDALHAPFARASRRRPLAWTAAAVVLVAGAFGLGLLVARHHPSRVATARSDWAVRGRISIPATEGMPQPILAPSSTGLWLAYPHGTEVYHLSVGRTLHVDQQVTVPPVQALVADDQHLWILAVNGDLLDLTAGATPVEVAALGSLSSSRPTIAVAGGRVWVGGTTAGGVVAVDPDGSVTPVPRTNVPAILAGSGDAVWSIDATSGSAALIDPVTATIRRTMHVGAVVDAVPDATGLWLAGAGTGDLVHLNEAGHRIELVDATLGSTITRLASTGALVWTANSQVLRAFDLSGRPLHTLVVTRDDSSLAGSPGGIWLADNGTHTITLVAPS